MDWCKLKLVAGGALLSTLGYRILRSRDAKKLYSFAAATVLREKEHIMGIVTDIKEDCCDIYADAKAINEKYTEENDKIIEDRAIRQAAAAESAAE